MEKFITSFLGEIDDTMEKIPVKEIAKALSILQGTYEQDGRIYVFGNGGSLALANHWVSDFNKTVFSHHLDHEVKRFQAIRVPTTEEEITAWANDVGFDMIFAGPLKNYLQESDAIIAISSSGNSTNVIKAVELAKAHDVPVVGISGFDGGRLNELADAKVLVPTEKGKYEIVESIHGGILHLMTKYFKDYFDYMVSRETKSE